MADTSDVYRPCWNMRRRASSSRLCESWVKKYAAPYEAPLSYSCCVASVHGCDLCWTDAPRQVRECCAQPAQQSSVSRLQKALSEGETAPLQDSRRIFNGGMARSLAVIATAANVPVATTVVAK